jgi:hypothetical protein
MPLIFDEGKKVEFGEKLEDAERILGCAAIDDLSYTARKGVDKIIPPGSAR